MKNILIMCLLFVSSACLAQSEHRIWTETERQLLMEGLQSSQDKLLNEIKGLTKRQMRFKPDSATWSIAEIVEHLAIYDELLYWDLLNQQYAPEMPEWAEKVKGLDAVMTAYTDDPMKLKAPFIAQPLDRFENENDLISYSNRFRNEIINLIKETDTDFRQHFVFRSKDAGVWRVRDLHQYTLLWIAHTQRHANQAKSVKTHRNYPK